jgi:hypothetical protein
MLDAFREQIMRVPLRRLSVLAASAAAWMALIVSAPARAVVTLETYLSPITCGITTAGETVPSSCDSLLFDAVLQPGQQAFLRQILTYHYTDDGLRIIPTRFIQAHISGLGPQIAVDYEAAALHFYSNDCTGSRYCGFPPSVMVIGTRFDPLVLGLNDHPDDFWGAKELFVNVAYSSGAQGPFSIRLSAGWGPELFSAPVPEPSTFGLMAVGLLALGLLSWRRRAP